MNHSGRIRDNRCMSRLAFRSVIRLVALLLALGCGWVAIATEQKGHVALCVFGGDARGAYVRPAPSNNSSGLISGPCAFPIGTTWLVGPTVAMSFAILAALAFALVAISPRQGTLLTYRWRRAIY
jgi:hypothetical protein